MSCLNWWAAQILRMRLFGSFWLSPGILSTAAIPSEAAAVSSTNPLSHLERPLLFRCTGHWIGRKKDFCYLNCSQKSHEPLLKGTLKTVFPVEGWANLPHCWRTTLGSLGAGARARAGGTRESLGWVTALSFLFQGKRGKKFRPKHPFQSAKSGVLCPLQTPAHVFSKTSSVAEARLPQSYSYILYVSPVDSCLLGYWSHVLVMRPQITVPQMQHPESHHQHLILGTGGVAIFRVPWGHSIIINNWSI